MEIDPDQRVCFRGEPAGGALPPVGGLREPLQKILSLCLGELGVDHILEVGPGNALSGFVKKTLPGVTCVSVETPAQLDTVLNAWKEEQ